MERREYRHQVAGDERRGDQAVGEGFETRETGLIAKTLRLICDIFFAKTRNTGYQLIRSLIIGGIAFSADYAVLYVLGVVLKVYYLAAAIPAYLVGFAVSHALTKLFVFTEKARSAGKELAVFFMVNLVGLGLTELIIYLFTDVAGLYFMVSKIIATVIVFFWNFFGRRKFVGKV